ncbi:MAG: hypothetical protein ACE37B_13465 [Ilumatobacter sp.]|uniref:hypothetical protein n=1 Tax=Ilumatobacter sp. TaxID=1967498 RepID=UPI0039187BF5
MQVRPRSRFVAASIGAVLLTVACGGDDDDGDALVNADVVESAEPSGDAAATASLTSAQLVWAIDGEPVGGEFSYVEPIERTRFDAGLRWELRFDATGDVGDVAVEGRRTATVNGDLIESGRSNVGPERGMYYVDGTFDVGADIGPDGGEIVVRIDVARPVSATTLIEDRRRFQALTGFDPDDEQVEFSDVAVFNVDRVVDLPLAPVDGVNVYEYAFDGDLVLGNRSTVAVDSLVELRVVGPEPVAVDPAAPCGVLAEQYVAQVDAQLADPEFVHLDRMHAMNAVERAAIERDCAPVEFQLPICAIVDDLVVQSGGDPSLPPWSEATVICPDGASLQEATVVAATHADGVLQMVVPATIDGLPPLAVAVATPEWTVGVNPPRTNGQEIEFEWPGASGFREAWFEVSSSAMPPSLLDERFEAAVTVEDPSGREIARESGAAGAERSEWFVAATADSYEFGGAVVLDDERLLRLRGRVTSEDGRVPTDESVAELARCVVESVVVGPWSVTSPPPEPSAVCTDLGVFAASAADAPVEADAEVEADAPVEALPPSSYDGVTVTLSVPPDRELPAHVVQLAATGWSVGRIDDGSTSQVVDLDGDGDLTILTVAARFAGDVDERSAELLDPGDDWSFVSEQDVSWAGGSARLVITDRAAASSGAVAREANLVAPLDENRLLHVTLRTWWDSDRDFDADLALLLESLTIAG